MGAGAGGGGMGCGAGAGGAAAAGGGDGGIAAGGGGGTGAASSQWVGSGAVVDMVGLRSGIVAVLFFRLVFPGVSPALSQGYAPPRSSSSIDCLSRTVSTMSRSFSSMFAVSLGLMVPSAFKIHMETTRVWPER